MPEETASTSPLARPAQGLLRSKSLWLAFLITLAGGAWWAYSAATREVTGPTPSATSSLVDSAPAAQNTSSATPPPASFRYGASFIGAFLIAYVLKKVIKSVLFIAALLIAAIVTLKYFGFMSYDWSSARHQVEQGVGFARDEGEKYRTLVMGYLPSGLAAGAGAIFGARRG
ncbi:MAG: FUN14 domain-containing protein [Phycisphaerales bacterium]